jgi:hypothetical protein
MAFLGFKSLPRSFKRTRDTSVFVIALTREDDEGLLKKALGDYLAVGRPIIGFSTLNCRDDLFSLARGLKDEGALTIPAGP